MYVYIYVCVCVCARAGASEKNPVVSSFWPTCRVYTCPANSAQKALIVRKSFGSK